LKDFLQNRPRVSAPSSRKQAGASAAANAVPTPMFDAALLGTMSGNHGQGSGHDASVEAIKEGDRVVKLVVTCRCGEKIEILCAYTPGQR
jgi:hypothetical protein